MKILKSVLIVLVSLLMGAAAVVFAVKQYPQVLGLTKGSTLVASEIDALISEVSKLIELPEGERPTVATISNAEEAKAQPFFAKAQNGDKVLIYTSAKRAILYRPGEKRIIEVGAVNINQASPSPETGPEALPSAE